MKRTRDTRSGFTLIELVIVLVLIGILAAVAIPRFHNMKFAAEAASIRGTLGNVRSAISIWRANALAFNQDTGSTGWPTLAQLETTGVGGEVLQSAMPENPWATTDGTSIVPSADVEADPGGGVGTVVDATAAGWFYNASSGEFWANSDEDLSGTGTPENEW